MAALRCFVAMAFREEMERVYDESIKRTLKRLNVAPIRVDRVEHNDPIDDRIISEIESCDFAIVDLTLARPSVYYEAGYAERKVPVIYTCRKDHLVRVPKTDDSLQVHFDLQMKNIIPWESAGDKKFAAKLAARIRKVIAPLLQKLQQEEEDQADRKRFASLPLKERTSRILTEGCKLLLRSGYGGYPLDDPSIRWLFRRFRDRDEWDWNSLYKLAPGWLGWKRADDASQSIFVTVRPSIIQQNLLVLNRSVLSATLCNVSRHGKAFSRLLDRIVLCSLQPLPTHRTDKVLSRYTRVDDDPRHFVFDAKEEVSTAPISGYTDLYLSAYAHSYCTVESASGKPHEFRAEKGSILVNGSEPVPVKPVPREIHVFLIDKIESEKQFSGTFKAMLASF